MLGAIGLTVLGVTATMLRLCERAPPDLAAPDRPRVVWTFEPPERGAIISTPLVAGDRVYVSAIHDRGLHPGGAVYALDRATGKAVWKFDDDGEMLHTYSSPCVADGRLYVGEGMHANFECKFYCLDAATGKKLWHHAAAGHIESSPCVADGRVYVCSGDDGLYCLDAATGKVVWQFTDELHLDSNPAVAGGRVYVGSGVSRRYQATLALCLDAATGKVVWRLPTDLPAWGSPAVVGDRVYFGLGNGRLSNSAERPAGALLCVRADTGRRLWDYAVPDAVLAQPAVDGGRVYFGCRDGCCYAVSADEGKRLWQHRLGSPVVTRPAVRGDRLYVVASDGRLDRLDADAGTLLGTFDLAAHAQARPQVFSSPVVAGEGRVYLGTELKGPVNSTAVVYCLDW
jgi:outer membrane protein assembly factor BamB